MYEQHRRGCAGVFFSQLFKKESNYYYGTKPSKNKKLKQPEKTVLDRLTQAANCLEEAAVQLTRNSLNEAKFDAVELHAKEIAEMRTQALALSEQSVLKGTIESLASFLREKAQKYPWFSEHVEEVILLWENLWTAKNVSQLKKLQEGIEQKKKELSRYFEEWSEANANEQAARTALNNCNTLVCIPTVVR